MTKANEQEQSVENPQKNKKIIVAIIVLILIGIGYIYVDMPAKSPDGNKTSIPVFSNVSIVVEPGLGRIRLPNVTDHKFIAKLKAMKGDFFTVLDVTVENKGNDREFGFTVMHSIGGEEKGLSKIVRYSELPQKYLQAGKWTVWVKREDQLK